MADFKKIAVCLDAEFVLEAGKEEAACVDLDGEWSEKSKIYRHPEFINKGIEFISAEVGEGGDHMNITFKNISDSVIKIPGDVDVALLSENPDEPEPIANVPEQSTIEPDQTVETSDSAVDAPEPTADASQPTTGASESAIDAPEPTSDAPEPTAEPSEPTMETPEATDETSEVAKQTPQSSEPIAKPSDASAETFQSTADKSESGGDKSNPPVDEPEADTEKPEATSDEPEQSSDVATNSEDATISAIEATSHEQADPNELVDEPMDTDSSNDPALAVDDPAPADSEEADFGLPVIESVSTVTDMESADSNQATDETEQSESGAEPMEAEDSAPVDKAKDAFAADNAKDGVTAGKDAVAAEKAEAVKEAVESKDVEESMDTSETNEDAKVKVKTADDVSAKKANSEEASTSPTVNGDVTEEAKESVGAASIQVDENGSQAEPPMMNGDKPKPSIEELAVDEFVKVAKKETKKPMMMMFVNETEADDHPEPDSNLLIDEEDDEEKDSPTKNGTDKEEEEEKKAEGKEGDEQKKKEDKDKVKEVDTKDISIDVKDIKVDEEPKPSKIKIASLANITEKPKPRPIAPKVAPAVRGCGQCQKPIPSVKRSVVWATMHFCTMNCLAAYQDTLSNCSTCKKGVDAKTSKYCVRFGSEIKQFCSKLCFEDYKKGLKVCSYCQKDISGGEGFMAPIGDKTQFKDFCQATCLEKYEVRYNLKEEVKETDVCAVCREKKLIEQYIVRAQFEAKLCGQASCFSAYKFVNSVETSQCGNCKKHYDISTTPNTIYFEGRELGNCCKVCQNVSVVVQRKKVNCAHCHVEKYNFDMIEIFEDGDNGPPSRYCSQHCRSLHKGSSGSGLVISAISSLAMPAAKLPELPTQPLPQSQLPVPVSAPIQIQKQIVKEVSVVKETVVLPPEAVALKNKSMQTKPFMVTKGVSCKPHTSTKGTQTEGPTQPTLLPIATPVHVPVPCQMYNAPFPVPVPIPLPFPVPIFIPTTRNSFKGIQKQMKKIMNKIPADPYEAELLALAGNIAEDEKDSSDSEDDAGEIDEGEAAASNQLQQLLPQPDLENEMSAEKIVPKPLPISTPEPGQQFPAYMNQYQHQGNKRRASNRDSDPDDPETDDDWRPQSIWDQRPARPSRQSQRRQRGGRSNQQNKRARVDAVSREQQMAAAVAAQQPKERQDVNHHLKFTYGVNAWKHWVVGKNAELEKQRAMGKYQKAFETDILKLRADELNFTLCLFVKEVKKPNGDSYAADSILYLVLGIQEYLFENNRIDNIFTDMYYDPFTSALHEVVKDFKLPVNELGYFVTRIEEEHLWESKQLGAHSPQVLLNTLVYFNTKYFQLKTVDQHLKLSFSHIMKHWKKANIVKSGEQQRTVLLRYYPPPIKAQKNEERKMYEQHENHENALRCPVKLYEFYLSKCPESTKNRNDMFYLQPERSCVPDSPVWYTAHLLNRFNMEKMLARLLMVREVQEHMLADAN